MFIFLRAIGLDPIEWEDAIEATRLGSPHNLTAVRAAMDLAQAVVVVLTAEDRAGLISELAEAGSVEPLPQGQPRQNVTLEAGMAIGIDPARTILVQLGAIRGASDFDGLNRVNLGNDAESRRALVRRLKTAGCTVNDDGADWLSPAGGGDFDASVVVADADTAPALDDVMAIPTTDLSGGQRAELNVRCFRLPDDAAVVCAVTHPGGETLETQALGQSVGNDQTLHTAVYPESFPNAPVMAGHHTVNWVALSADGRQRRDRYDRLPVPVTSAVSAPTGLASRQSDLLKGHPAPVAARRPAELRWRARCSVAPGVAAVGGRERIAGSG